MHVCRGGQCMPRGPHADWSACPGTYNPVYSAERASYTWHPSTLQQTNFIPQPIRCAHSFTTCLHTAFTRPFQNSTVCVGTGCHAHGGLNVPSFTASRQCQSSTRGHMGHPRAYWQSTRCPAPAQPPGSYLQSALAGQAVLWAARLGYTFWRQP